MRRRDMVRGFRREHQRYENTDTRELNAIVAMMPEWKRTENPIRQGPYGVVRGFRKT